MKSRKEIENASLAFLLCVDMLVLSAHEPIGYQSQVTNSNVGNIETDSGSPGLSESRGHDTSKPAINAGMFKMAANLNGQGQT